MFNEIALDNMFCWILVLHLIWAVPYQIMAEALHLYQESLPTMCGILSWGRGQSGNCTGTGMSLFQKSTQISILRIAN